MRRVVLLGLALGLICATLSAVPTRWDLPASASGDQSLASAVREMKPAGHALAVVFVAPGGVRGAYWRCDGTTTFEIGSVSKPLTGLVLADAVARGEMSLDDPLGRFLDLGSSAAASIPVWQAATHTSGLPRGPRPRGSGGWSSAYTGVDVRQLEADARSVTLGEQVFGYSNLGGALVGQAVAKAAGLSYPDLMRTRLFEPLAMSQSAAQTTRPLVGGGYNAVGVRQPPWLLDAYAPMGGIVSTPEDLTRLVQALIDGSAPGVSALDPRVSSGVERQEGLLWDVHPYGDGRVMASHPGGTPGYAAYLAVDRVSRTGVVVLSDSRINVEGIGESLMREPPPS